MAELTVQMTDPRKVDYAYREAVKTLRTNIQFAGKNIRSILITSCFPNEGKSDVVMQLAREFGNIGKRVVLLDADIRKSSLLSRYQIRKRIKGLSQYLSGQTSIESVLYKTNFDNVDIIFAGPTAPNPSELLTDSAFSDLLLVLRQNYDYVLVDTPPIIGMSDAAIAAQSCDGSILVMESKRVSYRIAQKAKESLTNSGSHILGVVLNKVDMARERYYSRYSYGYGSGYYGKTEEE